MYYIRKTERINKKISKNSIEEILKEFSNVKANIKNKEFIQKFIDTYIGDDIISASTLKEKIHNYVKYGNFSSKMTLDRCLNLGYSREESRLIITRFGLSNKEKINHKNDLEDYVYKKSHTIFFDNDEIFNYFLVCQSQKYSDQIYAFNFNLNNKNHIRKIADMVVIDGFKKYATAGEVYSIFKKYQNSLFPKDKPYTGYITLQKEFYIARGYSEEEAKDFISKRQRTVTQRCPEYFEKQGFSREESIKKTSEYQQKNAYNSRMSVKYWLNQGYSEEDAKKQSYEFSKEHSVWWWKYWLNQGYSEEDAKKKAMEYNPATMSFSKYNGEIKLYVKFLEKMSQKIKNAWKTSEKYKLCIKKGEIVTKSKIEVLYFDFLKEFIDPNIKNDPYPVFFPDGFVSKNKNLYFYACDGYLEYNHNIIIFEYDGLIWHNKDNDKIRDEEIQMLDPYILGIIRMSESRVSMKNINLVKSDTKLINDIKDAIQKIKDQKEKIIRFE